MGPPSLSLFHPFESRFTAAGAVMGSSPSAEKLSSYYVSIEA